MVEAIVRSIDNDGELWGLPGSHVTRYAVDDYNYVDERSYLKTPHVFGFHGVYKRLSAECVSQKRRPALPKDDLPPATAKASNKRKRTLASDESCSSIPLFSTPLSPLKAGVAFFPLETDRALFLGEINAALNQPRKATVYTVRCVITFSIGILPNRWCSRKLRVVRKGWFLATSPWDGRD